MPESAREPNVVGFDAYELRLSTRELLKYGLRVKLPPQAFRVLQMLVEHPGELISRENFHRALWPGDTFVDFDQGLNTAVKKIRDVLNDSAETPCYIETLPRLGYRFIGKIDGGTHPKAAAETADDKSTGEEALLNPALAASLPEEPVAHGTRRHWAISSLITGLVILAATLIGMRVASFRKDGSHPHPGIRSIAVLPFENLSGDPSQDYFADGISDALLTNLAQIHSLRVISRTSSLRYRDSRKSLSEIAKDLNVDAVVEGTFSRSNERVRVTAQLIQAPTDRHIWAEAYDRKVEDILSMQSAIALEVARHVSAVLSSEEQLRLSRSPRITPEAQEAYLRARYLMNLRGRENLIRAPAYFQLAITKDPNFADAYAGLAESYGMLAAWGLADDKEINPKLAVATKAVELDPESSAAHAAMALYLRSQMDRNGSKREIKRALELNPNNSNAHKLYGFYLAFDGQLQEGIDEEMVAVDLDPLAAHLHISLGHLLSNARQFDSAISHWQKAMELDPNLTFLHLNVGWTYAHKGMQEEAIREWSLYWAKNPEISRILISAYEQFGYQGYLRALLGRDFATAFQPMRWSHYQRAVIFTELGENDLAFESLAKAIDERDMDLDELTVDPDLEKLRSDSRFPGLVARWSHYGLPAETSR